MPGRRRAVEGRGRCGSIRACRRVGGQRSRHRLGTISGRRRTWIVVVVVLVATPGIALVASVRDRGGSATPESPRFVDETTSRGHRATGTTVTSTSSSAAAWRHSTATTTGATTSTSPEVHEPAALYRNESPVGGALRFRRRTVGRHRSRVGHRRVSPRHRRRRPHGSGRPPPRRQRHPPRASATAGSRRANDRFGIDARRRVDRRLQRDVGRARTVAHAGVRQLPGTRHLRLRQERARATRRPATGRYAPPIALDPGYCALSALFSDWDRSGERDLRLANDRNYYRDGSEQLWRVAPGEAPRLYTERDGWRPLQIWGMGIASQDLTGDGRPEVFITSQGDNKLQTLVGGDALPTYADIALERGVTAQRPYAGGDVLPSTAWHPEFGDVNNDGFVDLFITKGNVEAQVDYAQSRSEQPPAGSPRWHVRRGGAGRGHRRVRAGSWRRARRPEPRRHARPRRGRTGARTSRCGATSAGVTPSSPARGPLDRAAAPTAGPEPGRHRCVGGGEGRRSAPSTAKSPSAAATPVASSAGSTSGSAITTPLASASSGPTARPGRGWTRAPTSS